MITIAGSQDGNVFHSWSGYDPEEIDRAIAGRFYD